MGKYYPKTISCYSETKTDTCLAVDFFYIIYVLTFWLTCELYFYTYIGRRMMMITKLCDAKFCRH